MWPTTADALREEQSRLRGATAPVWRPGPAPWSVGGCWATFPRGVTGSGAAGDPTWAAAVVLRGRRVVARRVCRDVADAPFLPTFLALRLGRATASVVESLPLRPDVLLLDATARDHPRGAGLALHVGQRLDLPTIGVTHRPLGAEGDWPADRAGATSPLVLDGEVVGCWLRTRPGTRPLAVHPGWRVDLATTVRVVATVSVQRTPEPLRQARRLAREARASDERRDGGWPAQLSGSPGHRPREVRS